MIIRLFVDFSIVLFFDRGSGGGKLLFWTKIGLLLYFDGDK